MRDDLKIAILFSAHELNPLVNAIDRVLYLGGGRAVLGAVDEVVTGPVLSRLYGAPIEVVRVEGRYFVMAGGVERRTRRASPRRRITLTPTSTRRMFEYDFMRTAFAAAGMAAVLAGTVGFFLVLRGQTFAGHALSHVGFTGATGAALFGLSPLAGLVGFTLVAGIGMGLFGEKLAAARCRDRHDAVARAGPRAAVPAFLHHRGDAGGGAAVRQCARRRRRRR